MRLKYTFFVLYIYTSGLIKPVQNKPEVRVKISWISFSRKKNGPGSDPQEIPDPDPPYHLFPQQKRTQIDINFFSLEN